MATFNATILVRFDGGRSAPHAGGDHAVLRGEAETGVEALASIPSTLVSCGVQGDLHRGGAREGIPTALLREVRVAVPAVDELRERVIVVPAFRSSS